MISKRILPVCLLAAFVIVGCKRKPEAEPEAAAPPPPPASKVALDDGSGAPPPPPPPPAPVAEAPPITDTTGDTSTPEGRLAEQLRQRPPQGDGQMPTQKALIWAVDRFDERYLRAPKDVYELVAKGLLKNPPPPPSGKKYQLDTHNYLLELVDK